ncbi:MAG: hypothetical protein ABI042_10555 [Verrucomicrobiota bacterium]
MLGQAAHLAISPQITVALAAVAAVTYLKKSYDELQEVMKGGDWSTVTGYIAEQQKVAAEAAADFNAYARELQAVATAQKSIATETDAALTKLQAQHAWIKKVIDAQNELAAAEIERDLKSGKISPEQAEGKKNALAKKKIDEDAQAELNQARAELQIQDEAQAKLRKKEKNFLPTIAQDEAAVGEAKKKDTVAKAEFKRDALALGRDADGNEIDKEGKIITKDSEGKRSAKRSGELGKLDELEDQSQKREREFKSVGSRTFSNQFSYDAAEKHAKEAEQDFKAQEHFVATAEKLFKQNPGRVGRIKNESDIASEKLAADKTEQKKDLADDRNYTDTKRPEALEKIRRAEDKQKVLVPIQKKTEDVKSSGVIEEYRKSDAEKKAKQFKKDGEEYDPGNGRDRSSKPFSDAGGVKEAADRMASKDDELGPVIISAFEESTARSSARLAFVEKGLRDLNSRLQRGINPNA